MADGIKITISGLKQFVTRLSGLQADIDRATRREIKIAALEMQRNIKRKMRGPGRGRPRTSSRNKGTLASAPGDSPVTDRGRLITSIAFNIRKNGLQARVGTNVKYGKLLENGTKDISPRPWLKPEFDRIEKVFIDRIIRRIRKAT